MRAPRASVAPSSDHRPTCASGSPASAGGGAGALVLTHFSSRYADVSRLAGQARDRAGGADVLAAEDLDRIPVPRGW